MYLQKRCSVGCIAGYAVTHAFTGYPQLKTDAHYVKLSVHAVPRLLLKFRVDPSLER